MLPILSPSESAELDRASAERGVSVDWLMENAGRATARTAARVAGGTYGRRAVVVCGKGNNGGDGLVAARYLERWGMAVTAVLMAEPAEYGGAAATNFRRYAEAGGRWKRYSIRSLQREVDRAAVAVDAIFGTGFRGSPGGGYAEAIEVLNGVAAPVVAVDIPSGVEGETGAVRAGAVQATATVTFGALKPGVVFFPGAGRAGTAEVADIGFPPDLVRSDLCLVERDDAARLIRPRPPDGHKRTSGFALIMAGSRAMTGAAILAAHSAYRAGAGLVTLAVPQGILAVVEGAITEATFLPLPETDQGTVSDRAWPELLDRLQGVGAAGLGPGLSTNEETASLIRRFVAESPVPFVLDADGLTAFKGRSASLADRRSEAVITPHAGEFGRLTGLSAEEVLQDRVGNARKAAAEFGCSVLLKGSRTVVAEPGGRARVNPTGGPFLATGGTGDVLTGAIAGIIASGVGVADAAVLAAYAHGLAGERAARDLGNGTTASDVSAWLPRILAEFEEEVR